MVKKNIEQKKRTSKINIHETVFVWLQLFWFKTTQQKDLQENNTLKKAVKNSNKNNRLLMQNQK